MSRSTVVILLLSWFLFCQSTSTSAQSESQPPDAPKPDRQPGKSAFQELTSCIGTDERTYRDDPNDDLETRLLKEKIRAARGAVESVRGRFQEGREQIDPLHDAQKRVITSLLDFHTDPADAIALMKKNIELARQVEEHQKLRLDGGLGLPEEYARAVYFRADAELQLLRYQRKNKNAR